MSLAVLKRKTKATYKTKKGTFSLNGTQRNLSYVGKNYAGMTRNPYCFTNSKTIKKSVGNQNTVIRNRTEFSKKDIDVNSLIDGEVINIYVETTGTDAPYYNFYLDEGATTLLSPELTLNLNNVYNFIRINDGHAFYLSSNSEPFGEEFGSFTVGTDNITIDGSSIANVDDSLTLSFSSSATPENTTLYFYCTVHPDDMKGTFTLVEACSNLPRPGTFQTICNNWVQRVEPDGNVSQAEYIKNKRILATTTQDTSKKQSGTARCDSNGKPCISTYVDTTKEVMKSSDYNSVAISKRASIYRAWQKPFPYVVSAGNSKCIKRNSQANELIDTYYKGACDGMTICNDNLCD